MARQAREPLIPITSSTVIDYPEQWADETGPFGGAFSWAMEHMTENTEVVGVRLEYNRFERPDLYRFRLIRGIGGDVRGKMEVQNHRHFTIKSGYMGLVENVDEWIRRWIMVIDQNDQLRWHLDWEMIRRTYPTPELPPLTAHALVGQLASLISQASQDLVDRNWCRESFGLSFRALRGSRMGHIVTGTATPGMRHMYHETIQTLSANPDGLTNDVLDQLVILAKQCCGVNDDEA